MSEKQYIIVTNGRVLTLGSEPKVIENGAVCIDRKTGKIAFVDESEKVKSACPDAEVIDADGKLVMPGFICAHTHFYSMFSRGKALAGPPAKTFIQVLQRLWWELDKALSLEDVYLSAVSCVIQAIKCGTTTLIDHHASPNAVAGSLDEIAKATLGAGVRACLCYEVTDRNSEEEANAGISENIRFMQRCAKEPSPLLAATFGLHASFTVNEKIMETISARLRREVPPETVGVHIHVSESSFDQDDAEYKCGMTPVQRLEKHGLLGHRSICVHCVAISESDEDILKETDTIVVHNPSSNMNNAVGFAKVQRMMEKGVLVGLGTDGMSQDMISEFKQGYVGHKLAQKDPQAMSWQLGEMLFKSNAMIAERFFGFPIGHLTPGAAGDVIILDYYPPTPITPGNWPWHFMFGITPADVNTTIVAGKVLMKDHILNLPKPQFDEKAVFERARERSKDVWAKF
ncbi:putative Amidohydrolase family protein [Monocercomonoides exilis]|uniref:putative Amidohydrolase family protein n=1 Tax=Monocercomonoides exilis TaxID=2049356 RepID=UPI00355A8782|nr:putative Amidohydrolase family protein [Monocercomonoides exilis]|eukprot:MONOS_5688.1-p1 / transcript=MONOS_5688.1 / gene=MONOS_5688 / organism=Monocercomonoides_exilis_PA203 / gene_product=Amidohydrolase family protein / transcript_product=Amidohydrolase family protein / location=Mono_scaffold00168:97422-99341(+) / protein_length=458 / sequence_SO=supercontig / SO=protein_coding / is_pseudo=false